MTTTDPQRIEVIDDPMAVLWRAKSGTERLAIAAGMVDFARWLIQSHLAADHPEWSDAQVALETSRRIAHGGV